MTVFDNLENYDIPEGSTLSVYQEDQFAKDIAEIIHELDARKTSKKETRKYFKGHLRYTSNVNDYFADEEREVDLPEGVDYYHPMPGEYQWDSDLLQSAILDVIRPEVFKFGYIYNFIHEDMEYRNVPDARYWSRIEDRVVLFAQKYDSEHICQHARSIKDPADRLLYLNEVSADLKKEYGFSRDEEQEVVYPLRTMLDALITEAKDAFEIWIKTPKRESTEVLPWDSSDSTSLETVSPDNYAFDHDAFVDKIVSEFGHSFELPDGRINLEALYRIELTIDSEFQLFVGQSNLSGRHSTEEILSCINQWEDTIKRAIDYAYSKCPAYEYTHKYDHNGVKEVIEESIDNLNVAKMAVQALKLTTYNYKATLLYNNRECKEILYTVWDGGHQTVLKERERLTGAFGAINKLKEYTDPAINIKLFYESLTPFIKSSILESIAKSDNPDIIARTQDTYTNLEAYLRFLHKEFINLFNSDPCARFTPHFEDKVWIEVTKFCFVSTFYEAEKAVIVDEDLSHYCSISPIISLHFDKLDNLLDQIWDEMISRTGDSQQDEYLNDLGIVDTDIKVNSIPVFDSSLIGDHFVTDDEWRHAMGIDEKYPDDPETDSKIVAALDAGGQTALEQAKKIWNQAGYRVIDSDGTVHEPGSLDTPAEGNVFIENGGGQEESDAVVSTGQLNPNEHKSEEEVATNTPGFNGKEGRVKYLPKNMREIDVEVVYTFIKNQEKTSLTLDDYQYAIDYADFSALLADAKVHRCSDYPLCIIMKLKDKFEDDWYEAACKSVGKSKKRVSGFHHENGVMHTIYMHFPSKLTK